MRQLSFIEPGIVRWEEVPDPSIETADDALVRPLVVTTCDLDPWEQTPEAIVADLRKPVFVR